jgi:phage-related baseplate assembly protein
MDFPTRAELFEVAADEALIRAQARAPERRISPSEVFTEGSDVNLLISSSSAMGDELGRAAAEAFGALFLASAEGPDLDRLIADRFGAEVVRKGASAAIVPVVFFRTGGPLPAVTLPVGTRIGTRTGVTFVLVNAATLAGGNTGPTTVLAQCSSAGLDGNVDIGAITEIIDATGDPNVQVRNDEPAAGGDDTEGDGSLKARARAFWRAARRGTAAAIVFGALTVPGVRQASVIEALEPSGNPSGRVALYIADANGQSNSALTAAVRAALVEYRAAGIFVDVQSSTPTFVSIVLRLRFAASFDSSLVFDQVRRAIVAYVGTLAPGATLTRAALYSIARSISGAIVLEDAIVEPVGDVVPTTGQVLRTALELVTPVV